MLMVIEVSNVHRSATLYRDAFGVDLHVEDHEGGVHDGDDRWTSGVHAAHSWNDGAFLHFALYPAKQDGPTKNVQVGFSVSNLNAAHKRALDNGAELIHGPRLEPWGATSRYRDLDGNVVSFTETR